MLRLCACLRALLRMRRSADLVFGIGYNRSIVRSPHSSPGAAIVNREFSLQFPSKLDRKDFQPGNLSIPWLPHDVGFRHAVLRSRGWIDQLDRVIDFDGLDRSATVADFARLDFVWFSLVESR